MPKLKSGRAAFVVAAGLICAFALLGTAQVTGTGAQDRVEAPGPDIHFKGSKGQIERGVRCGTRSVSREEAAAVERALEEFRAQRPPGGGGGVTIPVVFHVIHDGTEGNVPDSMVNAQLQVLNQAFSGTGFSFAMQAINRVEIFES